MIVQLTGTLVEATPSQAVLDVSGVGYALGISALTAASLPAAGSEGVCLYTRLVVREDAMTLYGFATREERALFDRLVSISSVGPKLALSVLSTYSPKQLYDVVMAEDSALMCRVPGVGKKVASRLILELKGSFQKDADLFSLVGMGATPQASGQESLPAAGSVDEDVATALLSMGFTSREIELALQGREEAGANSLEAAVAYALHRLGQS